MRDFALSCKVKYDKDILGGALGGRVYEDNPEMIKNLKPVYERLCQHKEWYNIEWDQKHFDDQWHKQKFIVNVTRDEDIDGKQTHHKDNINVSWASLVYLGDGPGGTNFYQWKEDTPLGNDYDIRKDIVFTSEMKYNRMLLYEARQMHGAILEKGMFDTDPRLAQVFFM